VLADGTYDNRRSFSDREGDRLYAAHLGRAVLRAGVVLGANAGPSGAALRGIRFDVEDPAKTFEGSIVHVWGSATHAAVRDTWLDGNGVVDAGLIVRQPEGFVAQRVVARAFRGYGVLVDPNQDRYRAHAPYVLEDLAISQVMRPVPGSSDGTAEACLWLGSTGTLKRARVRYCGVSGIWTWNRQHGLARTGRHRRSHARRHLHRAFHDRHDLPASARRAERRSRRERRVGEPRALRQARQRRERDRELLLPHETHWRVPRRGGRPGRWYAVARSSGRAAPRSATTRASTTGITGNDFSGIAPNAVHVSYQHGAQ
jgi:hypothetical protein